MTRLRRLMEEELQRRNYSEITAVCYLRQVAAFAKHFGRSPELLGPEEVKKFQLHLIQKRVSWKIRNPKVGDVPARAQNANAARGVIAGKGAA